MTQFNDEQVEQLNKVAKAEQPMQKYLIQLLTLIFLAGGGWVTLSNVNALAEDNKARIEEQESRDNEVEKKLVRIEVRQEQIKEDIKEMQETNRQILDEVRKK